MSNEEIDNLLNNIRRSKSSVSRTGFGHDVLMSQKIPEPPGAPPPPLPSRRPSQEYASEYQRSPFGRHENVPPCVRRSRNREAERSSINSSPQLRGNENMNNCNKPKHYPYVLKPSSENVSLPTDTPIGNQMDNLSDENEKDYKRISVTEEENFRLSYNIKEEVIHRYSICE